VSTLVVANWTARREVLHIARMREASTAVWLLPFGLLVFTIVAVPLLILDHQGLPRYQALRSELDRVRINNERLQREVDVLRRHTTRLRDDPQAVERIARDELGLVQDGEIIFQFPN